MHAQAEKRLARLLTKYGSVWHAGRTVELTLYKGDGGKEDYVGTMMTPELADLVALCHDYAYEQLIKNLDA
jgi:hypothetical protein